AAGTAPRGARSGKRADTGASRALDIARRVLAEAGEAPPAAARTNDGEASHD
ncbi:XRE family transcriptional regulator, partial [Burkholderia multivorans]